MSRYTGLLSLLIWLPIVGGRRRALPGGATASPPGAGLRSSRRSSRSWRRCRCFAAFDTSTTATSSSPRSCRGFPALPGVLRAGRGRHRAAAHHPHHADHRAGDRRGLDGRSSSAPAQYFAAFLIMEGLMVGVFSATDALLFYFFWEAMLIPMFLIIGIWGGPRRVYATDQVLPVHVPRLRLHAGGADLHVREGGATTRSRASRHCRSRSWSSAGSSSPSCWPSP